jgi:integrase-like protein
MAELTTGSGGEDSSARPRPRLLEQVHDAIRRRYFSRRTEEACVHRIKRFIYFSDKRHPATLGEADVM